MTHLEAARAIKNAFENLDGEKRIPYVVKVLSAESEITIFPMSQLNEFCKKRFGDDYSSLIKVLENICCYGAFSTDDNWCLWDETDREFASSIWVSDFIGWDEDLLKVILDDEHGLEVLGFTEKEEKELRKAIASGK